MKRSNALYLAQAGVVAALYVALTLIFAPFSFREIQVRLAEALTILPMFTSAAVPGLFVGCVLANLLGGALPTDVIFGSIATLIGAYFTRRLRLSGPFIAVLPPIIANTVVVPLVLRYAYGLNTALPLMMLTVCAGEVISCGVLGIGLYYALSRRRDAIFK